MLGRITFVVIATIRRDLRNGSGGELEATAAAAVGLLSSPLRAPLALS